MIADKLENAENYYCLGERFAEAFEYLKAADLASMEPGRYPVNGDEVFVLIQEYDTKPLEDCKWESHKLYADIQYIIAGSELMGYAPIGELTDAVDHTPAKDAINYKDGGGKGRYLALEDGMFVLFLPQDGHMPNIVSGEPRANKKAVMKVLV